MASPPPPSYLVHLNPSPDPPPHQPAAHIDILNFEIDFAQRLTNATRRKGGPSMPVGRWMELIGMDRKPPGARHEPAPPLEPTMTTRPMRQHTLSRLRDSDMDLELSSSPSPQPSQQPERERKAAVKKEEKDGGLWEPWLEMSKGHFKPLKV